MNKDKKVPFNNWKLIGLIFIIVVPGVLLLFYSDAIFYPNNLGTSVTKQDALEFCGALIGAASAAWLGWLALKQSHRQRLDSEGYEKKRLELENDFNKLVKSVNNIMEYQFIQQYHIKVIFRNAEIHDGLLQVYYTSIGTIHPSNVILYKKEFMLLNDPTVAIFNDDQDFTFSPPEKIEHTGELVFHIDFPLINGRTEDNPLYRSAIKSGTQRVHLFFVVQFINETSGNNSLLLNKCYDPFEESFETDISSLSPFSCTLIKL